MESHSFFDAHCEAVQLGQIRPATQFLTFKSYADLGKYPHNYSVQYCYAPATKTEQSVCLSVYCSARLLRTYLWSTRGELAERFWNKYVVYSWKRNTVWGGKEIRSIEKGCVLARKMICGRQWMGQRSNLWFRSQFTWLVKMYVRIWQEYRKTFFFQSVCVLLHTDYFVLMDTFLTIWIKKSAYKSGIMMQKSNILRVQLETHHSR